MPSPRQWLLIAAVALVVTVTTAVLALTVEREPSAGRSVFHSAPSALTPTADPLASAHRDCPGRDSRIWDEGESTLSIDGDMTGEGTACVLIDLGVPQRVKTHLASTRALDGMQTDSWDEYEARWSYHPDNGIDLTVWRR